MDWLQGINQYGEIVGVGWDDSQSVGLYWAQYGAEPDVLSPLPGDSGSYAYAINKNGVICGCSSAQFPVYESESQCGRSGNPLIDYEYRAVVWLINDDGIVGPVRTAHVGICLRCGHQRQRRRCGRSCGRIVR